MTLFYACVVSLSTVVILVSQIGVKPKLCNGDYLGVQPLKIGVWGKSPERSENFFVFAKITYGNFSLFGGTELENCFNQEVHFFKAFISLKLKQNDFVLRLCCFFKYSGYFSFADWREAKTLQWGLFGGSAAEDWGLGKKPRTLGEFFCFCKNNLR